MVIDEVKAAGRSRRAAEARERKMADEAAERRHRELHPEDFLDDQEIADMEDRLREKYKARFGEEKEIVIREPQMVTCPHCSGVLPLPANMRFWAADEVLAFGELLANGERIAAANRESINAAYLPATPVPSVDEEVA